MIIPFSAPSRVMRRIERTCRQLDIMFDAGASDGQLFKHRSALHDALEHLGCMTVRPHVMASLVPKLDRVQLIIRKVDIESFRLHALYLKVCRKLWNPSANDEEHPADRHGDVGATRFGWPLFPSHEEEVDTPTLRVVK